MPSNIIEEIAEILATAILREIEGKAGLRSKMERSLAW
jgi:hypothetical protein